MESSYHCWRGQSGGMPADELKRLKELEQENEWLKRIAADLTRDQLILK